MITARSVHPSKDVCVTQRTIGAHCTQKGHVNLLSVTKGCWQRGVFAVYGLFPPSKYTKTERKISYPEIHL